MKLTYLGHQGWMISHLNTNVLVDPIFTRSFGTSSALRFHVYPPRRINMADMPKISAVVVTNEHLDHFHLISLQLIPKDIPIIMSDFMPQASIDILEADGQTVLQAKNGENIEISDIKLRLYLGDESSEFWEKRVCHAYFYTGELAVFIQSDAMVSHQFKEDIENELCIPPLVFVTTNNSQIPPQDIRGAFDNVLPLAEDNINHGPYGIRLLFELLTRYTEGLPYIPYIVLNGGGYVQEPMKHGLFLLGDQKILSEQANKLCLGQKIIGPYPGDCLVLNQGIIEIEKSDWIDIDEQKIESIKKQGAIDSKDVLQKGPIIPLETHSDSINILIEEELQIMAKCILLSKLGSFIIATDEYLDGPVNSNRFIINLNRVNELPIQYVLNINKCKFVEIEIPENEMITHFPYGIDMYFSDFVALLEGKIHIWELATARMNQWYLCSRLESPVAFLYRYFSEQVRPSIAKKMYHHIAENRDSLFSYHNQ